MDIHQQARKHAHTILGSTVLAVDPASGGTSDPGYAYYRNGVLISSGTLPLVGSGAVQHRLRLLYHGLTQYPAAVLVVERIRGPRAHEYLHWAVGVAVAAVCPQLLIEMPVSSWKQLAGAGHLKTDENDAIAIGNALIHMAGG